MQHEDNAQSHSFVCPRVSVSWPLSESTRDLSLNAVKETYLWWFPGSEGAITATTANIVSLQLKERLCIEKTRHSVNGLPNHCNLPCFVVSITGRVKFESRVLTWWSQREAVMFLYCCLQCFQGNFLLSFFLDFSCNLTLANSHLHHHEEMKTKTCFQNMWSYCIFSGKVIDSWKDEHSSKVYFFIYCMSVHRYLWLACLLWLPRKRGIPRQKLSWTSREPGVFIHLALILKSTPRSGSGSVCRVFFHTSARFCCGCTFCKV